VDFVAFVAEVFGDHFPDFAIVLDDEDTAVAGHESSSETQE
jgi:hypothetical protein